MMTLGYAVVSVEVPSFFPDTTRVWRIDFQIDTENEIEEALRTASLSATEWQRALRYKRPLDRLRFGITRSVLRQHLGHRLGLAPAEICFTETPLGKPQLALPNASPTLSFNVSHSGQYALVAFSESGEIGVDIERMQTIQDAAELDSLIQYCFSPAEVALWKSMPISVQQDYFFTVWTCKEAVLKAIGLGIGEHLQALSILINNFNSPYLALPDPLRAELFQTRPIELCALPAPAGYLAALALVTSPS